MVSGQVVDTITNMRTVKLFAHDGFEDAAAVNAMAEYLDTTLKFGFVSTTFRTVLTMIAGALPVLMAGSTLWLWIAGHGHGRRHRRHRGRGAADRADDGHGSALP